MQRIKEWFFSEKGMNFINVLFFLSVIFRGSGLAIAAQAAWIVYLSFCIKRTKSKSLKVVYFVFVGIASIMICANLYFLRMRAN